MKKWIIFGLLIGFGFSCSVKNKNEKQVDKLVLPDSLFALKNIINADLVYKKSQIFLILSSTLLHFIFK